MASNELMNLLRYGKRSYSVSEIPEALSGMKLTSAEISLQLLEALSAGRVVEELDQLRLSETERSGW